MTRNLFLGADLTPAIGAPDIAGGDRRRGHGLERAPGARSSPSASVPLAKEIKASKADLVGLQEVALWRKQTPSDGGAPPISPIAGCHRRRPRSRSTSSRCCRRSSAPATSVVVVQEEFDAELPVDAGPQRHDRHRAARRRSAPTSTRRLTMRDVILVRKGSKVKLGKTRAGHYKTRYEPNVGGIVIPVDRGWARSRRTIGKRKFRFVNTHLEAFGDPKIREAQAKELTKGPLKTKEQVILVGDLNSGDRPPQRAREARRRPRLHGAREVRDEGQRRAPELLLREPLRTPTRASTTPSTTCCPSRR